jgi:hypothetical protein
MHTVHVLNASDLPIWGVKVWLVHFRSVDDPHPDVRTEFFEMIAPRSTQQVVVGITQLSEAPFGGLPPGRPWPVEFSDNARRRWVRDGDGYLLGGDHPEGYKGAPEGRSV